MTNQVIIKGPDLDGIFWLHIDTPHAKARINLGRYPKPVDPTVGTTLVHKALQAVAEPLTFDEVVDIETPKF